MFIGQFQICSGGSIGHGFTRSSISVSAGVQPDAAGKPAAMQIRISQSMGFSGVCAYAPTTWQSMAAQILVPPKSAFETVISVPSRQSKLSV